MGTREEAVYQTVVPAAPAFMQHGVAPPPPPETFGSYTKKTQESTGVITMIDMLAQDLDKEMQEATVRETHGRCQRQTCVRLQINRRERKLQSRARGRTANPHGWQGSGHEGAECNPRVHQRTAR